MTSTEPEARAGDDEDVFDAWSPDEWWRAQNPGSSAARGLVWALAISAVPWAVICVVIWALTLRN